MIEFSSDDDGSDNKSFQWLIFYLMLMLYLVTVVTWYGVRLNSFCIVGEWGMVDNYSSVLLVLGCWLGVQCTYRLKDNI